VDEIDQPEAREQHILQTLQVWKHAVPNARTAVLPPHTHHPNPLVIGDTEGAIYCLRSPAAPARTT